MRFLSSAVLAAVIVAGAVGTAVADPGVATHEPVVDKVSPAIVSIACKSPPRKNMGEMGWFGTGTVISEDGAILTSTTVVPTDVKPDSIEVSFARGKKIKAEFVCASAELEIAMLRLPKGKYPWVPMGDSKTLKLGHVVYTFGNCQNVMENDDQVAFAQGEVSGFYKISDVFEDKAWYEWCTYKGDVVETTAPLNPGVDGGPLIDCHGRLVGIMSLSYNETRWLGVAVPQHILADRIGHWLKGEAVKDAPKVTPKKPDPLPKDPDVEEDEDAPYLGVSFEADEPVIASVAKGSPAAKAKLEAGDRIVKIDGKDMKSPAGVAKAIKSHKPGDVIELTVQHGEKETTTLKIKLGYQPM
ncbi:MAG: S1C family serine protease [Planctomycetes bacterium]|nr:S1C family serine protease [Planctomycetota bacterium]